MSRLRRFASLGLYVLCLVACGRKEVAPGAPDASAAPSPLSAEQSRAVDFVWYAQRDGKTVGGTTAGKVFVKPNPSGDVRVAVYEEFSGGTGSQWRSSVWMASFLAAATVGRPLTDAEFGVSVGGMLDGPSAGALTTAAFLAALTDAPVRPEVTMSGIVNPDGSIGPVGGLPHKLAGAAEHGKKRFGYPVGQRYDQDLGTGQLVDLVELGGERGVETQELRDIHDAYALLTGRRLARPEPLQSAEMELPAKVFTRMQAKTTAWVAKAGSSRLLARRTLQKLPPPLRFQALDAKVTELIARAEAEQRQGLVPAAFGSALQAAAAADVLARIASSCVRIVEGDIQALLIELQSLEAVEARHAAFLAQLSTETPESVDGLNRLIEAHQGAASALASLRLARQQTRELAQLVAGVNKGQLPREWAAMLAQAAGYRAAVLSMLLGAKAVSPMLQYVMADYLIEASRDLYDAEARSGEPFTVSEPAVRELARSYISAAKANLDYYDSLMLEAQAQTAGASLAVAKAAKAHDDLGYKLALEQMAFALANRERPGLHETLASLAASLNVYMTSSVLVAKEYSLGVSVQGDGTLKVSQDKALASMLELAEQKAREAAAQAKAAVGAVPISAQSDYLFARARREGDVEAKVAALEAFWKSSVESQLAVALARSRDSRPHTAAR
jgi:uncharacterized protein